MDNNSKYNIFSHEIDRPFSKGPNCADSGNESTHAQNA